MVSNFIPDLFAESILKKNGLTWETKDIQLSQIDWELSRDNHARLNTPIDVDHVSDLESSIDRGDKLPMMVVREMPNRKYQIWSGNHRGLAYKQSGWDKIVSVYVVKTNDEALLDIVPSALNGAIFVQPRKDRLQKAVSAVVDYGKTAKDAADTFGFRPETVVTAVAVFNARQDLVRLGIKHEKLPDTIVKSLKTLKNDNVLTQAATLCLNGKLTTDESKELCQKVKGAKTEIDQLGVVAEMSKSLGVNKCAPDEERPKVPAPIARKIQAALTILENNSDVRTIKQWGITNPSEADAIKNRIKSISRKLAEIIKRS